jgi:hypothetical protein
LSSSQLSADVTLSCRPCADEPGGGERALIQGKEDKMDTNLLIVIVVLVLLFGGGGFYWSRRGR